MSDTQRKTETRIHNAITERWSHQLTDLTNRLGISRNSRAFHRFYKTPRPKPTAGAFGKKTK